MAGKAALYASDEPFLYYFIGCHVSLLAPRLRYGNPDQSFPLTVIALDGAEHPYPLRSDWVYPAE